MEAAVTSLGFIKAMEYATLDMDNIAGRMLRFREIFKQSLVRTTRGVDRFKSQIPAEEEDA
jgi:hypothetical protein